MIDVQYSEASRFGESSVKQCANVPDCLCRERLSIREVFRGLAARVFETVNRMLNLRGGQFVDSRLPKVLPRYRPSSL